jgi:hypothetical protein
LENKYFKFYNYPVIIHLTRKNISAFVSISYFKIFSKNREKHNLPCHTEFKKAEIKRNSWLSVGLEPTSLYTLQKDKNIY